MEISIIGVVTLFLSVLFFIKSEKWLLYLIVFLSTFTAASAINLNMIDYAVIPYEIPMCLWMLKQIINLIKNRKILKKDSIKKELKENKLFIALLFFIVSLILSEAWLLISKLNYNFYDTLHAQDKNISFNFSNFIRSVKIVILFLFFMMISIKVKDKKEIKNILKIFIVSSIFAVVWGYIQIFLFCINVHYPDFLFNNNYRYAQNFEQTIHDIKRVSSIALEPSTLAINLLAVIPLILIPILMDEKIKFKKAILSVIVVTITILTTSTTAILGLFVMFFIMSVYAVINYIIKGRDLKYRKMLLRIISVGIISIVVAGIIIIFEDLIYKYNVQKSIDKNISEVIDEEDLNNETKENKFENSINNSTNLLKEITIEKSNTQSGLERKERERQGIEIFAISPIFGIGFGTYRTFTLLTNILVNLGIAGLLSFMYIIFVLLKNLITYRKNDERVFLSFSLSLLGMMVPFMVSVPDINYLYFWIILILTNNYFAFDKEKS